MHRRRKNLQAAQGLSTVVDDEKGRGGGEMGGKEDQERDDEGEKDGVTRGHEDEEELFAE